MYDTRFKGSFKAVPIYVYKPCSIRKRTLGSISCNTTTSRSLRLIPLNWVPLELLQDSDLSQAIAPHWSSSYPKYLSPEQDKAEQQRVVWARLRSHHSNLANWLSQQKEQYLTLHQELNPRTTQAESSHEPLFRDSVLLQWQQDNKKHPVVYYLDTLNEAQWNYDIYKLELLAIAECLKHWIPYLAGCHDTTDRGLTRLGLS